MCPIETGFKGVVSKIDHSKKGVHCVVKKLIRTPAGIVRPASRGIISYEIDAFDKRLICVRWEDGGSAYVIPDEIEISSGNAAAKNMQTNKSEDEFD